MVRATARGNIASGHDAIRQSNYPEPVEACDSAAGSVAVTHGGAQDDHLSFVAGIGRAHATELTSAAADARWPPRGMPLPLAFKPTRGSTETYERAARAGARAASSSATRARRPRAAVPS